MEKKIFKPAYDKTYLAIWIITGVIVAVPTVFAVFAPVALAVMIPTDLFVLYFMISPLFSYVELRESSVFIRFGIFLKKEIPYGKIRGITKERRFYSDSTVSIKTSLDHVSIKYNTFDVVSVSVADADSFISKLEAYSGVTE